MPKKITIKPNDQSLVGKKVRLSRWPDGFFAKVAFVGDTKLFLQEIRTRDSGGEIKLIEDTAYINPREWSGHWELYE